MIEYEVIIHAGTMILTMGKCKIIYKVLISVKYHFKLPAKKILAKTHDQKTTLSISLILLANQIIQ